jgi:ribonuclease T2
VKHDKLGAFFRYAGVAALVLAAIIAVLTLRDRNPSRPANVAGVSTSSLLVVTWGPSLCKVASSHVGCRSGHVGSLGPSFVLHGLWPQPSTEQYCDVPKGTPDRDRKPVQLPPDLQASLKAMMSDSAVMTTHEWYAHGTCSGIAPPEYFGVAAALADQARRLLDPIFRKAAGRRVSARSVREAVEAQLGVGTGKRVGLTCRDASGVGSIVYEVRFSLPPVAQLQRDTPSLAGALAEGPTIAPGCGQAGLP